MKGALPAIAAMLAVAAPAQPGLDHSSEISAQLKAFAGYCANSLAIWGKSLCGPMVFVDPATGSASANRDPKVPGFTANGGQWQGHLPKDVPIANTSISLGATRFAEILLPLPADPIERRVLLAHEAFHRIQPALGFQGTEGDNGHLNSKDGRVLARLEAEALRLALAGQNWRKAARDALAFRAARNQRFPGSSAAEADMLGNEGLAEYTGIRVGAGANAVEWATKRLDSAATRPSLVRSFGYVVGPAYGLLLDRTGRAWRPQAIRGRPLPDLLAERIGVSAAPASVAASKRRQILAEEKARDLRMHQRIAELNAEFETGPTATFPLDAMSIDFDPNSLFALPGKGNVYTRSTAIRDRWGALHSNGDVLVSSDWKSARLPGPVSVKHESLSGPGWSAMLAEGFEAQSGERAGDIIIRRR